MQLSILNNSLQIEFTLTEKLIAVRFHKLWQIPLNHIISVTTNIPPKTLKDLRAPGTFVPGLIKAGTYYTDRGKEFWYVTRKNNFGQVLNIDLINETYQKIVLNNIENHQEWQQQLTQRK